MLAGLARQRDALRGQQGDHQARAGQADQDAVGGQQDHHQQREVRQRQQQIGQQVVALLGAEQHVRVQRAVVQAHGQFVVR